MVVAQALALLAWDVLLLAASYAAHTLGGRSTAESAAASMGITDSQWLTAGGISGIWASRSEASLFVELLMFGALLTGMLLTPLLRGLFRPAAAPSAIVDVHLCSGAGKDGHEGKSTAVQNGRTVSLQKSRMGQEGISHARGRLWRAVAAAALITAAAAAAIKPAVWALSFALATHRRVALLVYWIVLLLAALPLMDWVSRGRRVPTIIVRKVSIQLSLSFSLSMRNASKARAEHLNRLNALSPVMIACWAA